VTKGCRVSTVCSVMKRSRQSYYNAMQTRRRADIDHQKLSQLVDPIKRLMPRLGGKKLRYLLQDQMAENAIKMGRDRFFDWLRKQDLLVKPKKRYAHTTQSNHRFWVYNNLIKDLEVSGPNKVWVSDITYLRTRQGFCYLALITDAYSRKIVGYDVSDSLELEGCRRALDVAIQTANNIGQLIHHSDRGIQYCSNQYTGLLQKRGIKISMAAKGDCYENALAERVNGILKDEFNLDTTFHSKEHAIETVHQSIYIYNQHRPHWAIDLQTPNQRHAA
jgi:putative transposase